MLEDWLALAIEHDWHHAHAQLLLDAALTAHHAGRVASAEPISMKPPSSQMILATRPCSPSCKEFGRVHIGTLEDATPILERAVENAVATRQEAIEAQAWMLLVVSPNTGPARPGHGSVLQVVFERTGDRWASPRARMNGARSPGLKGDLETAERCTATHSPA